MEKKENKKERIKDIITLVTVLIHSLVQKWKKMRNVSYAYSYSKQHIYILLYLLILGFNTYSFLAFYRRGEGVAEGRSD